MMQITGKPFEIQYALYPTNVPTSIASLGLTRVAEI